MNNRFAILFDKVFSKIFQNIRDELDLSGIIWWEFVGLLVFSLVFSRLLVFSRKITLPLRAVPLTSTMKKMKNIQYPELSFAIR